MAGGPIQPETGGASGTPSGSGSPIGCRRGCWDNAMGEGAPTPQAKPRLARRSIQLGLVATLVALLPLVLLARLTIDRAQDAVRDEVAVRLRVTTALSASLLAEQLAGFVTLAEAEAKRPQLLRAVSSSDPTQFDAAEVDRELTALLASRDGLASSGLFDLGGVLRGSPVAPELVGRDFSMRDYYRGLLASGDTYVSEAFESAQAGHPLIVTIATYVRAPSPDGRTPGRPLAILVLGIELDVVHQRVEPLGWTVFAAVPHAQAYRGVAATRRTMLAIAVPLGVIVCCGIVLLVWLQRRQWRVEAALEVAGDQARDASRLKDEFLSRISHELRTPLNAILGFGQLLQTDDLTGEQRDSVNQVMRGGRHLLALINEVLDISRIETGSLALSLEAVNLMEVVTETADLIGPLAAERQVSIRPPSPQDGSWTVHADRQRLRQVLLNLASNAVKYNHDHGSIHLTCHATSEGRVSIIVADTGPGIPADKLQRLFMPFDRLGAEQTDVQGTGLGLALSRGLVQAMGGTLTAHSIQGQGTTFTLELAVAEDLLERHDQDPPTPASPTQDAGGHREHTMLYVEDNPSNLQLVERILGQRGGVRLLTASQGEIVGDMVRQHRPDLVLLDLQLPGIDGEEVLRRLQADPHTAGAPVVVVSAEVTRSGNRQRLLAAGAAEYLTKPLDVPHFLEVIDRLLAVAHANDGREPLA